MNTSTQFACWMKKLFCIVDKRWVAEKGTYPVIQADSKQRFHSNLLSIPHWLKIEEIIK